MLPSFLPDVAHTPEKQVIGYVASGYGKTDEKEVKSHIDRYKVRSSIESASPIRPRDGWDMKSTCRSIYHIEWSTNLVTMCAWLILAASVVNLFQFYLSDSSDPRFLVSVLV